MKIGMTGSHKTIIIEESFLNTSNTKSECNTQRSTNSDKMNNFIKALNEIKGKKEIQNINLGRNKFQYNSFVNVNVYSTEYDKNISENSLANANLSREENLINFINHSVEKNFEIVNNNIKKKKLNIGQQYKTNAHFAYKMDFILNPLLNKAKKLIESGYLKCEKKENIQNEKKENTNRNSYSHLNSEINNTNQINKTAINSKNKCSIAYDSNNVSQNNEKIVEIKSFQINPKIPKSTNNVTEYINQIQPLEFNKFLLDDLDEIKDINLVNYQNEENSSAIIKKLNISDLDTFNLDINFDVSRDQNSNSYDCNNNFEKKTSKNSKILIVDSVLNSSNSNPQNIFSFDNKISESGKNNFKNGNHASCQFLNRTNSNSNTVVNLINQQRIFIPRVSSLKNSSDFNFVQIYSNSINLKDSSIRDTQNPLEREFNTTQKRIRRKYFKSEIFDSNSYGVTFNNMEYQNPYLQSRSRDSLITDKKKKINKNLITKFNITLNEYDMEKIDLISDFEDNYHLINSSVENINEKKMENTFIEHKIISYNYDTPLSKVRSNNLINEWTNIQMKISYLNFSNTKKSSGYQKSGRKNTNSSLIMVVNEEEDNFVDTVFDLEFINNLLAREFYYRPDPEFILKHPRLEVRHRTLLVEWLMELSEEFAFKRDTFHYCINYIDRFLSKYFDISRRSLQLIGVVSLSIAAKFEEVQIPKVEDYLNSTDNSYTQEEFIATERLVLKTLKWEILPSTNNTWLNWYACQWDLYIDSIPNIKESLNELNKEPIFFKKADEQSYTNFRKAAQLIDIFTVDYFSLAHTSRRLVAASLFIVICNIYEIGHFLNFNIDKFDYEAEFFQDVLSQKSNIIIDIFSDFLQQSFNFSYEDTKLINAIVYASKFLTLEFNYNLPLVMQSEQTENGNYEDFLSYQTHNQNNRECLKLVYKDKVDINGI